MSLYSNLILRDQPVAYWQMGEASGQIADSSGHGNTGTPSGSPTYGQVGGIVSGGTAIQFASATSDRFTVTDTAVLDPTIFSVEAWLSKTSATVGDFIDKRSGNTGLLLRSTATQTVRFFAGNGTTLPFAESQSLSAGFHHIVGTNDGITLRLYVDGSQVATQVAGGAYSPGNNNLLLSGSNRLNGTMQHVSIYNYVLTAAQVANHYNAGIRAAMLDMRSPRGMLVGASRGGMRIAQAGVA